MAHWIVWGDASRRTAIGVRFDEHKVAGTHGDALLAQVCVNVGVRALSGSNADKAPPGTWPVGEFETI